MDHQTLVNSIELLNLAFLAFTVAAVGLGLLSYLKKWEKMRVWAMNGLIFVLVLLSVEAFVFFLSIVAVGFFASLKYFTE